MLKEIEYWTEPRKDGRGTRTFGNYLCECGVVFRADRSNIRRGNTTRCKSCAIASRAAIRTKHGHSFSTAPAGSPEGKCYYTWQAMKRRCYKPYDKRYERYGGRGIGVCKRWLDSYEAFLSDMGLPPSTGHSVERVDNDGDYKPSNCVWILVADQASNRGNNRQITVGGVTRTLAEWARQSGVNRETIARRIDALGWTEEKAVQPAGAPMLKKYRTPDGDFSSLSEVASHYGMSLSGAYNRIRSDAYPDWNAIKR